MQNRMITEPNKECIASVAMYRQMVDKGLDIYDILSQFIKFIIHEKKLKGFTVQEINQNLKEIFNYSVPEAAVKEAIKKINFIELAKDHYRLVSDIDYDNDFLINKERLEKEADDIFNNIVEFIETKNSKLLNDSEKLKVFGELFDFLIKNEHKNKEYTKLISLWVLQNTDNTHIQNTLNMIKEGILVTCAFEYTPNELKEKNWNTPLTLYYDVENLFSLEGLNGEPYNSLSNDLYNLILDCNKKNNKPLIHLMYFSTVKQEVESFYNAAFEILRRGKKTFQNRTAMANILSGCEYPSDAQERKVRFFKRLGYKGFKEFDVSEYKEEDYQYNIIDNKTIEKLKSQFPKYSEEDLYRIQAVLNKINYLRKDNNSSFYKCGHFFVTETGAMLNIALHSDVLRPDMVPLATNIEYLTERIWSKVNSSFGSNKPKTVNAVVMAQLILSSQVNIVIREKYEELQKRYKEEQIDEEEANEILTSLKEARNKSQQISSTNVENIVEFLDISIDDEICKRKVLLEKLQETEKKLSTIEDEKIKSDEQNRLEQLEDSENKNRYLDMKQKIQKRFLPLVVLFIILLGITNLITRFIDNSFIKLLLDILNNISFAGCIISGSIMIIKLRLLEKMKSKDW